MIQQRELRLPITIGRLETAEAQSPSKIHGDRERCRHKETGV